MKNKKLVTVLCILLAAALVSHTTDTEAAKGNAGKKAAGTLNACGVCHDELSSLLAATHPHVAGRNLSACMECHSLKKRRMTEKNAFDTRIHSTHLKGSVGADCLDCHTWQPGKNFGLAGTTESFSSPSRNDMELLKQMFASATGSGHLDARHFSKGISCRSCHGLDLIGGDVDEKMCLACHGPMEKLISKTTPKDFPDRNPHKSHLGDISCTVCHSAHAASKVYCLECHPKFTMTFK